MSAAQNSVPWVEKNTFQQTHEFLERPWSTRRAHVPVPTLPVTAFYKGESQEKNFTGD
jgi:hypothetical protein